MNRPRVMPPTTALLWLASLSLFASACADDPPSPALVEDLRILAIRAEPPELLIDRNAVSPSPNADMASPPAGDPAGEQAVTFEALVLDPRGGPMQFSWRFCPVDSNQTCGDFNEQHKRAPATFQAALEAAHAQSLSGDATITAGPHAGIARFRVPVAGELFAYHVADSALGLGNGAWTSAVLEMKSANETLRAQKRVVLAARDLAQWNPELAALGWQVCTPELSSDPSRRCLPLRPRAANRNPVLTGMEVARGALATATFVALEGPLLVAPGEKLRLRPVFSADSEETHQTIESTLQADQLVVVDHSEELIVSWFGTGGTFSDEQTARQLTKTLDNVFTAPAAAATTGALSLFVVARDQRGGVAWTEVPVVVRAP